MSEIKIKPDCREALNKLYEYIDGEITEVDKEKVKAHLEVCRPCLTYFEFERLFHEYVAARVPRPQAREEFKTGLLQRIRSESGGPVSNPGSTLRMMPRYALAASIALLVLVGAWFVNREQSSMSGNADWQLLADYHFHRIHDVEDGIETDDPHEAHQFIAAKLGADAGRLVPMELPNGLSYREACVMPFKAGKIAMLEWVSQQEDVSLILARSTCLPICSKPAMKLHGRDYHVVTTDGLNAVCWEEDGGYVCALLAPKDFGEMLAWAEEVRGPGRF